MTMVEISQSERDELKRKAEKLETVLQENQALKTKNEDLSSNFKTAKAELKAKHEEKMLELTTDKEQAETQVKNFIEKLGIEEGTNIDSFLESVTNDLSSYSQIKQEQEKQRLEGIEKYTNFLNSTNKEGEDFLKDQAEVFGEGVLQNLKALENFALARGFKEGDKDNSKRIPVGKLEAGEPPKKYDSFSESIKSGDIQAAHTSAAKQLLNN